MITKIIKPVIEAIAKDLYRLLLFSGFIVYGFILWFSRAFYKGILIKVSNFEVTIWSLWSQKKRPRYFTIRSRHRFKTKLTR